MDAGQAVGLAVDPAERVGAGAIDERQPARERGGDALGDDGPDIGVRRPGPAARMRTAIGERASQNPSASGRPVRVVN